MATSSVPTLNMANRWGDPQQGSSQSSNDKNNTSLEMAMSGMNIVSAFGTSPVEFSASPDMQSEFSEELSGHQRKHIIDSGDSVHSQRSNNSNASPLPSIPTHRLHGVPPIGRPGHSKSSSISTSQSLTLTPTSSLDGTGTDIHDYNRRSKEEQELPTRITATFGDGFDGIHGARERANTAPGTMAFPSSLDSSFGSASAHRGSRNQLPPSRPPLAGASSYNPDFSVLSTISRPGYLPHSGGDPYLQRSTSDSGRESLLSSSYPGQMEQQSSKLSSFPSLPQQSGLNPNQPSFQPVSRHQRSFSGPVPVPVPDYMNQFQHHSEPPMGHTSQVSDFGVLPIDQGLRPAQMRYRNHSFGSAEEVSRAELHRRSSLQTLPGAGGFYGQQNQFDRRESLDYVPGHDMFMNDFDRARHVSPGHSPVHQHYGHHHHAEALSAQPMAMGGGGSMRMYGGNKRNSYGNQPPRHHRVPSLDDDSSHPLAGESIEVPSDDRGYMLDSSSHSVHSLRSGSESSHYMPEAVQHLPTAGASLPLAKVVYSVKFKRTQRSFVIGPRLNRDLKIGTYVKVEADRGEDLGIVVGKVSPEKRNYRGDMSIMPPATGTAGNTSDLKRIIRLATHDEVSLLSLKREEEDELLKICRTKVRQRGLPMNVVDAEYQFDRHKLTFFFEAEGRVDFRELVRDLFSMYKTRIWMQQLDKNTSAACRAASNPPVPVAMDFGTPIIAPMSEFREFMTE